MMILRRRMVPLVGAGVVLALVAGCSGGDGNGDPAPAENPGGDAAGASGANDNGGGDSADDPIEALYEAALEEGSVTWYSSAPADTPEAFEEAYPGISVEFIRLPAGQLGTRYSQERDAGAAPADMITIADERFIRDAEEKDWLEPSLDDVPAVADWPTECYEDGVIPVALSPIGIAANTDSVTTPPTTWEETLSDEFDGKIQNGDPRTVPSYLALMHILRQEYGGEFLQRLAEMGTSYEASTVSVNQNLAAGAQTLTLTDSYLLVQNLATEGAPIEFRDMNPTTGSVFFGAIPNDAENPNAARLLMHFLLTPEGQETFSADMVSPLGVDLVPSSIPLPEGWQFVDVDDVAAARDEILADLGLD